jgi:DNA polymerase III subunit delta
LRRFAAPARRLPPIARVRYRRRMAAPKAESLADLREAYVVVSTQQALIDEVVTRMKTRISGEADLNMNLDEFDAESASPDEVIGAARMMPFLSEKRVVLVKNAQRWNAGELTAMAAYLESPAPDASVIIAFLDTKPRPFAKSKLSKVAKEKKYLMERAGPRFPSDYVTWVADRARHQGLHLHADAATYLVDAVGTDLIALIQELDKLSIVYEKGARLDRDAVEAMVAPYERAGLYDYLDSAFAGRLADALGDLETLVVDVQPTVILYGLTDRLRELIRVRGLLDRGLKRADLERELGQPAWKVKKNAAMADRFKLVALVGLFESAVDIEEQMKTSRLDERLALDRLTVAVARSAGAT